MFRWLTPIAITLALSGCNRPDDRICSTPSPMTAAGAPALSPVENAMNCVHRWSYRLAHTDESLDNTADAVLAACDEPIVVYAADLEIKAPGASADLLKEMKGLAKFHVLQARAGHCAVI